MLKAMRKSSGATGQRVAEGVDLSRSAISTIERGHRATTLDNVLRWADVCGFELHMYFWPKGVADAG
jgi:transcriptional regulator with XRE-family HTH domain